MTVATRRPTAKIITEKNINYKTTYVTERLFTMYKIATLNKISPVGLSKLTDDYEIIEDLDAVEGIVVRSQDMKSMDFSDELLCIARAGVGVNNIPVDKCSENNIVVFNTPGANANAVKELVIAGMLLASRDIIGGSVWASGLEGDIAKQVEKGKSQFKGNEITGKTLGVIGLGGIGVPVANTAAMLGMNVIGYDAYLSVNNALHLSSGVKVVDSIDKMLPEVDFLTVHVHANSSTNGMINADSFSKIKPGAVLMNYARASIVDNAALKEALDKGIISKYICDFPNEETNLLPHTILTPHLGASTAEAEDNCATMAVEEMMDYIENGNITNSVNFPNCNLGKCTSESRITVFNKNIPNMIAQITTILSEYNINHMVNKSSGDYAYSIYDLDSKVDDSIAEKLTSIDGVTRVRIIK